jgi:hypothetical protein
MGKKKSFKRLIDNMAEGYTCGNPTPCREKQVIGQCPIPYQKNNEDQRIFYAIADIRDEIEDIKKCIRALLSHQGIDYSDVLKRRSL